MSNKRPYFFRKNFWSLSKRSLRRINDNDYFPNPSLQIVISSQGSSGNSEVTINTNNSGEISNGSAQLSESEDNDDSAWYLDLSPEKFLAAWVTNYNISHSATDHLLNYLRVACDFDIKKSAKGLLKTPNHTLVKPMDGGTFLYFGIEKGLQHLNIPADLTELCYSFNVDGVQANEKDTNSIYVTTAAIKQIPNSVHVIAMYYGNKKPNPNEYVAEFVEEWNDLYDKESVVIKKVTRNMKFKLDYISLDFIARAHLLNHKPSGYYSCAFCTIKGDVPKNEQSPEPEEGQRRRRRRRKPNITVRFVQNNNDPNIKPRTSEDYMNRRNSNADDNFFKDEILPKIFELKGIINSDIRKYFPLDPLHAISLGIFKRMLLGIKLGETKYQIPSGDFDKVYLREKIIKKFIVREMNSRFRSLQNIKHYKASEINLYFFYYGLITLRKLNTNSHMTTLYNHFVELSCFIRLMWKDEFNLNWNDLLQNSLNKWLVKYSDIYTPALCTLMSHMSICHILQEVIQHGKLMNFSSFKFESYFNVIRRRYNNHTKDPINSIGKRLSELFIAWSNLEHVNFIEADTFDFKPVSLNKDIATALHYRGSFISKNFRDSFFLTIHEKIIQIKNIKVTKADKLNKTAILTYVEIKRSDKNNLFTNPFDSTDIGIYVVSLKNELGEQEFECSPRDLKAKFLVLPLKPEEDTTDLFLFNQLSDIGSLHF